MKFISLLIIALLIDLGAIGSDSYQTGKKEKAKNIILLIGDGMGLTQTYVAYTYNKGVLNIYTLPVTGMSITYSSDNYITDSAAGGTAISTGSKTKNGAIGLDSANRNLVSILEIAKWNGLSTGIVVTCSLTHATPASFIAHVGHRAEQDSIALSFLNGTADIFIGGGRKYFMERADKRNLVKELKLKGYEFLNNLDSINISTSSKIGCLLAEDEMPMISEGRGDMLPHATKAAIEKLSKNPKGFFLMVEGSQIDWGGHNNDIQYVINETVDFDKAIGVALEFAKKDSNTLVIVTADHETGGLTMVGENLNHKDLKTKFSSNYHSAVPVMVYSYGPCSSTFTGCYQNTEIFFKMMNAFGFKK